MRRFLHLCHQHLRTEPIPLRAHIVVEPVSGCDKAHPEFERLLEQVAAEMNSRVNA